MQHLVEARVVEGVIDVLTLSLGVNQVGPAQDSQVLGCYGLYQSERNENVGNRTGTFVVDKENHVDAEAVVEGFKEVMRFTELQFLAL